MITIRIGDNLKSFEDVRNIDESWINQQINRRREDGLSVCVRVSIKESPLNMALSSTGCPRDQATEPARTKDIRPMGKGRHE